MNRKMLMEHLITSIKTSMKKKDLIKLLEPYDDEREIIIRDIEEGWYTHDFHVIEEWLYPRILGKYGIRYHDELYSIDKIPPINAVIIR